MKKILLLNVVLLLTMGTFLAIGSTQDYTQWYLPQGAKMRLGKGRINDITFSPDSTQFAVATSIGIWIYSAESGKELALLTGHEVAVMSVVFSSDGQTLVSVDSSGESRLWDALTGEQLAILTEADDIVENVLLSSDGTKLVTASLDNRFRVWKIRESNPQPIIIDGTEQSVDDIEFSHDGKLIAATLIPHHSQSGSPIENFRLQVWNTMTQQMVFNLYGENPRINTLKFSSDGKTLVTAENNGEIKFWTVDKGADRLTIKVGEKGIRTFAVASNRKILATAGIDNKIQLWEIPSEEKQSPQNQVFSELKEDISILEFSPDEKMLLAATQNGTMLAWDTDTKSQSLEISGHGTQIMHMAISENGKTLTTANSSFGNWVGSETHLLKWDIIEGEIVSSKILDKKGIKAVAPDCKTINIKDSEGKIELQDIETGNALFTITGHKNNELSGAFVFSLDGKTAAAVGKDNVIHLWQMANASHANKPWKTLKRHSKWIAAMAFSPDGKMLASGSRDKNINLWSLETGDILFTFAEHTNSVFALAFSPDGKTLASGSSGEIYLWDTTTGLQLNVCIPERLSTKMTLLFSPDSKTLVSICGGRILKFADREVMMASGGWITASNQSEGGGILQLWDAQTGELLSTRMGHTDFVNGLAFSKDGKTLATGSWDGTILLWDWAKISQVGNK